MKTYIYKDPSRFDVEQIHLMFLDCDFKSDQITVRYQEQGFFIPENLGHHSIINSKVFWSNYPES